MDNSAACQRQCNCRTPVINVTISPLDRHGCESRCLLETAYARINERLHFFNQAGQPRAR